MSVVAERSRVAVILADHAAADSSGKVNALGMGWAVSGNNSQTGLTAPQAVVVFIDSPPELYGEEFALTLTLRDEDGEPVELPGPPGAGGTMRVSQAARVEEPVFPPGAGIPRRMLWAHTQVILNLGNGLPLRPGHLYTWSLDIDTTHRPEWAVSFYVPGPASEPSRPVFGGPSNPTNIPGVDGTV